MKKLMIMSIVAIVAVPAMASMTVTMSPNSVGFKATVVNPGGDYNLAENFSFVTFCVEGAPNTVYMNYNVPYSATIDEYIMFGGASGGVAPWAKPTDETKQMYSAFLNGALSGSGMQNAIWSAEAGNLSSANTLLDGLGRTTNTALFEEAVAGWQNVKVLNLWFGNEYDGIDKQSQLIRVPVPGAFLLGGIGVSLVGWMKRRRSI